MVSRGVPANVESLLASVIETGSMLLLHVWAGRPLQARLYVGVLSTMTIVEDECVHEWWWRLATTMAGLQVGFQGGLGQ
jgi:hypothetical protein